MSKRKGTGGMNQILLPLFVRDTSGNGLSGLAYNTSGLTAQYRREGDPTWTTFLLADPTPNGGVGHWLSGGFIADGGVTGSYELGLPNEAVAAAAGARWVVVQLFGAADMREVLIEIELDKLDYQDSVRAGLSSLPNATADSTGGLPVYDVNKKVAAKLATGDIAADAIDGNSIKADAVTKIQSGLATAASQTGILNAVNAITTNTARSQPVVPFWFVRPQAGSSSYTVDLYLYDLQGHLQAPDADPVAHCRNAAGTSRDDHLASTTMTPVSTGHYRATYTVQSTDVAEAVYFDFAWSVGGIALADSGVAQVQDAESNATMLAIREDIVSLQSHGDSTWATATGFATEAQANTIRLKTDLIATDSGDSPAAKTAQATIAAVRAKTDNLPSDPAAASDVPSELEIADAVLARNVAHCEAIAPRTSLATLVLATTNKANTQSHVGYLTIYRTDGVSEHVQLPIAANVNAAPIEGVG